MAEILKDGEFLLPPEFLTDDDILMGKENFNGNGLCFPSKFPYEFTNSESDEEDISVLTRQFSRSTFQIPHKNSYPASNREAKWVYSSSPQSTLSAAGSWSFSSNGSSSGPSLEPSPPTTPFVHLDETSDLISAAAGQVARMKMSLKINRDGINENRGLIPPYRSLAHLNRNCVSNSPFPRNHFQQVRPEPAIKPDFSSIWGNQESERWLPPPRQVNQGRALRLGGENGRQILGPPPSVWLPPHGQTHWQQVQLPPQTNTPSANRRVFLSGSDGGGGCGGGCGLGLRPVKKKSVGTGVFIPRPLSDSRKKTDLLIARRNAAMAQQHRQSIRAEVMMKHNEVLLPQEWTY